MKKKTLFLLSMTLLCSTLVFGLCLDRPGPSRPNTGYCTIYNGDYHCIPGGYTCDGDEGNHLELQ